MPDPMNNTHARERVKAKRWHRLSRVLIIPIFMASGATSLIYETVWARQLHIVLGTSQVAISTVLAAFMAGLALGALAAARWAARTRHPVVWYAAAELLIGGYALLFPNILTHTEPVYMNVWLMFEPSPLAFSAFQFLLASLLLLPPTVCMGVTLPLLARFVMAQPDNAGRQVGRLYGANTLGAVIGTGLGGFVLLPQLGVWATTYWAAAANGALALSALSLAVMIGPLPTPPVNAPTGSTNRAGERPHARHSEPATSRALLAIAGLAGFSSLLCEVAWFRLTALMLGGSVYAFSIMLLAFLLGIGVGGWIGGWIADRAFARGGQARILHALTLIQLLVACLCWATMFFYSEMPFAYTWLYHATEEARHLMWPAMMALPLAIMLFPALFMGATFPFLVRAMTESGYALSRPVGWIYGMNTIGGIIGAAGGGLILLPILHISGSVLAAISLNLVAALLAGMTALAIRDRLRHRLVYRGNGCHDDDDHSHPLAQAAMGSPSYDSRPLLLCDNTQRPQPERHC